MRQRNTLVLGSGGLDSGEPLELCDENAQIVIEEIRNELGKSHSTPSDGRASC